MERMGYGYNYMVKNETKMMMIPNLKNDGDLLRTLRVTSRSLIVVLLMLSLPSIGLVMSSSSPSHVNDEFNLGCLVEEGILKKGHEGLIEDNLAESGFDILNQNVPDFRLLTESYGMNGENVNIPNEALDFVFVNNLKNVTAVDRVVKLGGVVISQLEDSKQFQLQPPANYVEVVYLRPLEHTILVLRKISHSSSMDGGLEKKTPQGRSLYEITPEAKKAALLGLEDAMLEPPTEKISKSKLSRKMKFLPDLLQDSLKSYPKRIFFSDGDKGVNEWFKKNYPTKGQEFEIYNMDDVVANEASNGKSSGAGLLSDWLRNHVKEKDYVVVKAEATLVEEMIKENTTCLVDELFLECKNQWGDEEEEDGEEQASNKRSYWQCLALYGRLRDEGVAVHQWWS